MEVLYPHCAGLDVHKESVVACSRQAEEGALTVQVRTFKTTTRELIALSDWLAAQGCTNIAMEATGVYWKPVWHILADGGFVLVLAHACHVKNVPRAQDRRERRSLAGRSAGPWPDPGQHGPRSAYPADTRPAAYPQAAGPRTGLVGD